MLIIILKSTPLYKFKPIKTLQGPGQITPLFNYKNLYYKIISMQLCNITISHSSTPYDTLGAMFKLKTVNYYTHIIALPTTLTQALLLPDPV